MTASDLWPANQLRPIELDLDQCRASLEEFARLLVTSEELDERPTILDFFRSHPYLTAALYTYNLNIPAPDRLAYELDLFGTFRADVVVGDSVTKNFVFVEFEDARRNSIFRQDQGRLTPEWSRRFEQGYSQIIDWFHLLYDLRPTGVINDKFWAASINFIALLVIGRRAFLNDAEFRRLRWRRERLVIDSKSVLCFTYDEFLDDLRRRIVVRSR